MAVTLAACQVKKVIGHLILLQGWHSGKSSESLHNLDNCFHTTNRSNQSIREAQAYS
jgi:hypothetical protein